MHRITDVVKHLLAINVIMALATWVLFPELAAFLSLYYPESTHFHPIQVVSHFFLHAGFMHLFFNMYALILFGPSLEAQYGPKKFLFYYLFCALGAAGLHTLYNWYDFSQLQAAIDAFNASPSYDTYWGFFNQVDLKLLTATGTEMSNTFSNALSAGDTSYAPEASKLMQDILASNMNVRVVGASGAIYGLLLAYGMQFPNAELMLIFLPIPIKAKYFIPLLMGVEFFLGMNSFSWDNIAHFAHLGGALSGFFLILYWRKSGSRLY
jgi:membrane associated rhomboid family serine protease